MRTQNWMQAVMVVSAMGLASAAGAATSTPMAGGTSATGVTNPSAAPSASTEKLGKTQGSAGANDRTASFPPDSFDAWMDQRAGTNNGRITRQDFLDQMGNRWDQNDREKHGYMTPDQARNIYSYGNGGMPARTGSTVVPGNLGPGNVRK